MQLQIPCRTRRGIAALLLHAGPVAALYTAPAAFITAPVTALLAAPAAAEVWTQPLPVMALAGLGDVLAAATAGGVVLWDLSGLRSQVVTTAQGLPTSGGSTQRVLGAGLSVRMVTVFWPQSPGRPPNLCPYGLRPLRG